MEAGRPPDTRKPARRYFTREGRRCRNPPGKLHRTDLDAIGDGQRPIRGRAVLDEPLRVERPEAPDASRHGQTRYSLWTGDLGFAIYLWDCVRGNAQFPTLDVFYPASHQAIR